VEESRGDIWGGFAGYEERGGGDFLGGLVEFLPIRGIMPIPDDLSLPPEDPAETKRIRREVKKALSDSIQFLPENRSPVINPLFPEGESPMDVILDQNKLLREQTAVMHEQTAVMREQITVTLNTSRRTENIAWAAIAVAITVALLGNLVSVIIALMVR